MAPRRRLLLAGTVLAVAVLAAVLVLRAVTSGRTPAGHPDQARPGAVLLVPGYGGNTGSLEPLAARLRATGRTATVVALPGDGTGDLAGQASTLQAAVLRAVPAQGPSVDLVGYSAGGVVVRLWVDRYDRGRHLARRVVTLGSPLHGTQLAALGTALVPGACPVACQQLVPGSPLLRQLDAAPLPAGLPWLSVWTRDDQTVTPPESARLAGALNVAVQDVCAGASVQHGQLPGDPMVTGLVLRTLGVSAPTTPAPADCPALRALGSS
ncbi:MAG TPA: lipase [Rugosimonospora sp.]|nr:lipase [Rugosimonospora sp.]